MACQTPAILRFLLATSILDRFCAALCECVLGSGAGSDDPPCDAQACIQWLESNNLFVIPLDNERQWYRYHHLFQELLQRRLLAEVGPDAGDRAPPQGRGLVRGTGFDRRSPAPRPGHQTTWTWPLELMVARAVRCAQSGGSGHIGSLAAPVAR